MDRSLLTLLNIERAARRAAILLTDLTNGDQRLVRKQDIDPTDPFSDEFAKRFKSGKSGIIRKPDSEFFLNVSVPSPRLVVIGAVHISQALVPMAEIAGFEVTVIDPRTAFATRERFPRGTLRADWPEDVLGSQPLDAYTAVAAVTHDPKIDDYALVEALQKKCFYVGALGSRKTHGQRLERLRRTGLTTELLQKIEAPIGLDIGSSSPEEIAVSVLGSVIKALRKPDEPDV